MDFFELKIQRPVAENASLKFLSASFRDVSAENRRRKNSDASFFGKTSELTRKVFSRESSRANDSWPDGFIA